MGCKSSTPKLLTPMARERPSLRTSSILRFTGSLNRGAYVADALCLCCQCGAPIRGVYTRPCLHSFKSILFRICLFALPKLGVESFIDVSIGHRVCDTQRVQPTPHNVRTQQDAACHCLQCLLSHRSCFGRSLYRQHGSCLVLRPSTPMERYAGPRHHERQHAQQIGPCSHLV